MTLQKKLLVLLVLSGFLISLSAEAAPKRRILKKAKSDSVSKRLEPPFYWAVYAGSNGANQLTERAANGDLNYLGSSTYRVGLEANFTNPKIDYAVGLSYNGSRSVTAFSGLLNQSTNGITWGSTQLYFLGRYKLGETFYLTGGLGYSLIDLQGNTAINSAHASTSFSVTGGLGYLAGIGFNFNKNIFLDLKYLVDRSTITFTGGPNNGKSFSLDQSGLSACLGYRF
jgi:opacity protein-like surface antigen